MRGNRGRSRRNLIAATTAGSRTQLRLRSAVPASGSAPGPYRCLLAYHLGVLLADIADAVDLEWSFVSEGRVQMAATGACEIPNFVRADALPAFVDDARRLASRAHPSGGLGTVYLGFPDESFPL